MKNRKIWIKLSLDLVMLVVFILLLYKNNFGMAFHEIAGLAVFGTFLLHIILNWRWVLAITKKFFDRQMKVRVRLSWLLNLGLFICFALIEVSGICMSRVVFQTSVKGNWKTLHYFCTAIAMILLGAHLGLHASMIGNATRKALHLRHGFAKALCALLTVAIVGLGCYSFTSTSFCRWLAMPFQMQGAMMQGERADLNRYGSDTASLDDPASSGDRDADDGFDRQKPSGDAITEEGSLPEMGKGMPSTGNMQHSGGSSSVLWNSLQMLAIIYLIAAVVACVEWLIKRRLRRQTVHPTVSNPV